MSWKVYRTGEMVHDNPYYNILPDDVFDEWIVDHMKDKVWVNMSTFLQALEKSRKIINELNNKTK